MHTSGFLHPHPPPLILSSEGVEVGGDLDEGGVDDDAVRTDDAGGGDDETRLCSQCEL